jgi:hypothetical protein
MQSAPAKLRLPLYFLLNALFLLAVLALDGMGGSPNARVLHLVLLFAVCSTPVLDLDGLNGRFVIPSLFLAFYFVSFGLLDFLNLPKGISSETTGGMFSKTEGVILTGAVMFTVGYRAAMALFGGSRQRRQERDWPLKSVVVIGVAMWLVGTVELFYWNVIVIPDNSAVAAKRGLESLGQYGTAALLIARMFQPFGILLIAYAWRATRSRALFLLVIAAVVLQVILGFVINVKSEAMIAGILVIVTFVLLEGRLPWGWLLGAALYGLTVYPIFVAARAEIHGNRAIARTAILENLVNTVELAIQAESRVTQGKFREQNFLERTSVRGSIQMVVQKTGVDVEFEHGATMTPLLVTFIPKFIWSGKATVETGRLVNKVFHVTEAEYSDTYISPSIPGELYWNFGWAGICIGMGAIGAAVGFLGQRFNLARTRTVTGLLVTVLTIKQVIVGLEGTFSPEYVVWFRSLAAVWLLHLLFARLPVGKWAGGSAAPVTADARAMVEATPLARFPNLLR